MKKSSLLSLLTATSIALTTAGTYATWDKIQVDTTSSEIAFRSPITIDISKALSLDTVNNNFNETPSASGDVSFTVKNDGEKATKLKIVPTIEGNGITLEDVDITLTESAESSASISGNATSGFIDTSLDSTTYQIKVTPKSNKSGNFSTEKSFTVKLTATLE